MSYEIISFLFICLCAQASFFFVTTVFVTIYSEYVMYFNQRCKSMCDTWHRLA